jgi:multiple sugar transport system substrate-binding protein
VALVVILVSCGGAPANSGPAAAPQAPTSAALQPAAAAPIEIVIWTPAQDKCDPLVERGLHLCQVEEFNNSQQEIHVTLKTSSADDWTNFIKTGALAGDLPDIINIDGPTLAFFAWSGYLRPLDDLLPADMQADFLSSIIRQGTYNGKLYMLGAFDSGLGIWGNKAYLEQAGVRIPTSVADAWTRTEFEQVLAKLQALDAVDYALDMKMNYGQGEWFTYGFAPIVQSMGGDLIDRKDYQSADGVLNAPASVEALTMFQSWFEQGYVKAQPVADTDFDEGKAALSWVGHWLYIRYMQALGENLILLPMPRLGERAATGTGSWGWVITANSQHPEAAWKYLEYILSPEQILRTTDVNGAVPARTTALARSKLYQPGGCCTIYPEQLDTIGVERPVTPAYPTITRAFAEAIANIANGADVKTELDKAVQKIDQDIKDNQGYSPK